MGRGLARPAQLGRLVGKVDAAECRHCTMPVGCAHQGPRNPGSEEITLIVSADSMLQTLSIQLFVYAGAWFLLGRAFGLARKAVLTWSGAWALLGFAGCWLSVPALAAWPATAASINILVVLAFMLLLEGTAHSTRTTVPRLSLWLPMVGVLIVDLLRFQWPAETAAFRWTLFALCIAWPVGQIGLWQAAALSKLGFARLAPLVWAPVVIVIGFFGLRALATVLNPGQVLGPLGDVTLSDRLAILLLLMALGAFNFAQASFVLGLMAHRMRELSHTDQLTQLANRRSLMLHLEREDARFRRTGRGFTLVIFDVDHFKTVNDRYGHVVGDKVLGAVSSALIREIRSNDLLARYGGEEFMLLMPEADVESAHLLAERIRIRVMQLPIQSGQDEIFVTLSAGVAGTLSADLDFEDVIRRADAALYRAKHGGRNQTAVDRVLHRGE